MFVEALLGNNQETPKKRIEGSKVDLKWSQLNLDEAIF